MNRNNLTISLLLGIVIGITVSLFIYLVFAGQATPIQSYEQPNWFTESEPVATNPGGITIGGVVLETPENTLQSENFESNLTKTVNPQ